MIATYGNKDNKDKETIILVRGQMGTGNYMKPNKLILKNTKIIF